MSRYMHMGPNISSLAGQAIYHSMGRGLGAPEKYYAFNISIERRESEDGA
jgi:hypothetical protein